MFRSVKSLLNSVWPSQRHRQYLAWVAQRGDETNRLRYDIDENSTVLDVGGYKGQWASDIFAMYSCNVHVFEPIPEFASMIKARFVKNPRVRVYPYGLSDRDEIVPMTVDGDASTTIHRYSAGHKVQCHFRACASLLTELNVGRIDLLKLNIEGGEYRLIQHLLDTGTIMHILNLQVQYHDFVPGAQHLRKSLHERLSLTHDLTWSFPFVWENYRLREAPTASVD